MKPGTERPTNSPLDVEPEKLGASHDGLQGATVPSERLFFNIFIASFEEAVEFRKQAAT